MTATKQDLRRARWAALRELGAARFPGAVGRIPNFTGAEAAASHLVAQRSFRAAEVVKCNPDLAQRPVRHAALKAGKTVLLAVPRLAEARPFVLLNPRRLAAGDLWRASSIAGAAELGRAIRVKAAPAVDLIVSGCVAVAPDGARLGKGGGYADLEYGLLREAGLVEARTPVVSTVHPSQVLEPGAIPMEAHDVALTGYATPQGYVRCTGRRRRPAGVLWDRLDPERRAAIPVLRRGRL